MWIPFWFSLPTPSLSRSLSLPLSLSLSLSLVLCASAHKTKILEAQALGDAPKEAACRQRRAAVPRSLCDRGPDNIQAPLFRV